MGNLTSILFISISVRGSGKGVLHKGGNGHRPDSAGNRGDVAAKGSHFVEFDVPFQGKPALFRRIGHPGNPHVDDDSALFDHIRSDKLPPANGRNDDIRLAAEFGDIPGLGMTEGYRAVAGVGIAAEQDAHRPAYDIAAAYHYGMHAPGIYLIMLQQ